jgi:hypothetical protein
MAKINKVILIDSDWVGFVCSHNAEEIVEYFKGFPFNAQFEADAGYELIDSNVYYEREETDEEYEQRIKHEALLCKISTERIALAQAANRKNVEDAIAQLQEQLRSMP